MAVEWAWIDVVDALWWDRSRSELVEWAGWTIDPFIEEVVRLLPLIVVLALLARARQQWSMSDLVVLGAGVGSGFRLAEHLARHGEEVRGPFAEVANDSGLVLGLAGLQGTLIIPYPWTWVRQWFPEGVQIEWFGLLRSPIGSYNVIAIWGTLGGLALAAWLPASRVGGFTRLHAVATGALLVGFAGLAHAQVNADLSSDDWVVPALAVPRWMEPQYWAWPLVVAAVAMAADWSVGRAARSSRAVAAVRVASGSSDVLALGRLALQQPRVSVAGVWSFVLARRALVNALASERIESRPGRAAPSADLLGTLQPVAVGLRQQLEDPGRDLWSEVAAARSASRQRRRSLVLRSPLAWVIGGLSAMLVLCPLAYLVAGTSGGGNRIQNWFEDSGSSALIGAAVVSLAFAIALLVAQSRSFRRASSVVAEPRARVILAMTAKIGAVASLVLGLSQVRSGASLDDAVYSDRFHGLDALGSLVWAAGINVGLLVIAASAPVVGVPLLRDHHRFKSPAELVGLLPTELRLLVLIGASVVMAEGRAVPGRWEDGDERPPPPLDAELDQIIDHAWEKHVLGEGDGVREFPEVETREELKDVLQEVIENATEWGYRGDGSVYWYDEVTDTVVIKNPPGVDGTTYRPGSASDG